LYDLAIDSHHGILSVPFQQDCGLTAPLLRAWLLRWVQVTVAGLSPAGGASSSVK